MQVINKHRWPQLDGLRGMGMLFVLSTHLFNYGFLSPYLGLGWIGIEAFFVLSGFLITGILLDTKDHPRYLKNFFAKRALRVLPLYYGILLVFVVIAPYFEPTKWFSDYQWYYWLYAGNLIKLEKSYLAPLGHFWSLAIEEQFYFVWPFVILFFRKKNVILFSCLLIILSISLRLICRDVSLPYSVPLAHLDGLSMGSIIAVIYRHWQNEMMKYIIPLFYLSSAGFLGYITLYFLPGGEDIIWPYKIFIIAFFFGTFLVMILRNKWLADIFSNKLLCFFGKYSYGMYVFNSIFFHFANWGGAFHLSPNRRLIIYAGVFILTIIASYLSYNFYEVYFLRLKDRFDTKKAVA